MESLPVEILMDIFEYLSYYELLRCAMVCKRWKSIVRKPKFFGALHFDHGMNLKWPIVQKVFAAADVFPFSTISMQGKYKVCMKQVKKLFDQKNIRDLRLFLDPKDVDFQLRWINRFTRVEYLRIDKGANVVDDLTKFKVMSCVKIFESDSLTVIEELTPKFPNLQKVVFYLSFFDGLFFSSAWEKVYKIAASVPKLEFQNIYIYGSSYVDGVQVADIEIEQIKYRFSDVLGMDSLLSIGKTFGNLQILTLYVDEWLTPTTFSEIAQCIPNLRELDVEKIGKWPIAYVLDDLTACKRLNSLELRFAVPEDEEVWYRLRFVKKAAHFLHLRTLLIWESGPWLTIKNKDFELAMISCTKLLHLELHCCLTKFQVESIATHLKGLKSLELSAAFDEDLAHLNDLRHLEWLGIESAEELTEFEIIRQFKIRSLTGLKINNAKNLTNDGIVAIADACPFIEILKLKGAVNVTDTFFESIYEIFGYLKYSNSSK